MFSLVVPVSFYPLSRNKEVDIWSSQELIVECSVSNRVHGNSDILTVQQIQLVHLALITQSHMAMKTNESDMRRLLSYQRFLFVRHIFYPE